MECWVVERGELEPERACEFDGPFTTKVAAIKHMGTLTDRQGATAHSVQPVIRIPMVKKSGVRGG